MLQVRQGIFETNSSSSHALVIRKKKELLDDLQESEHFTHEEKLESLDYLEKGKYKSDTEDWYFGRAPFRSLVTFQSRFQYAYANYRYSTEKINLLFSTIKKIGTRD